MKIKFEGWKDSDGNYVITDQQEAVNPSLTPIAEVLCELVEAMWSLDETLTVIANKLEGMKRC